jgi:signal transduction histidine kinase
MNTTIDDIIALSRGETAASVPLDVPALLGAALVRWQGRMSSAGRRLTAEWEDGLPCATAPSAALDHVLDALLDNALQHGRGTVHIKARGANGALYIGVSNEGSIEDKSDIFADGVSPAGGSGLGLGIARRLVEDAGGRLLLVRRQPSTEFTIVIPAAGPDDHR